MLTASHQQWLVSHVRISTQTLVINNYKLSNSAVIRMHYHVIGQFGGEKFSDFGE